MKDIQDIIGKDFRLISLKPLGKRLRNRRIKSKMRQPDVMLIITSENHKFKLLEVEDSSNSRFLHIKKMLHVLTGFDFVPQIMWSDSHRILVKYKEGQYPDFTKQHFARELGKHLATLHNTGVGTSDADGYYSQIAKNLESYFKDKGQESYSKRN